MRVRSLMIEDTLRRLPLQATLRGAIRVRDNMHDNAPFSLIRACCAKASLIRRLKRSTMRTSAFEDNECPLRLQEYL